MKKNIIIFFLFLSIFLIAQERIDDSYKDLWDSMTEYEKWESFKKTYNAFLELYRIYTEVEKKLNLITESYEEYIKLEKFKFTPKYALDINILGSLNSNLETNLYSFISFKKYFLYNRLYLNILGGIQFYPYYGGCLGIGLGFNW